jgi:hypothetical protein
MIQDLLWRCPLCETNDALIHTQPWLRPELVHCTACRVEWRVRRVVGDNYYLLITRAGKNATTFPPGTERSITAWYDLMKQTVRLEPLPERPGFFDSGERPYLASGQATLWAKAQPALFEVKPFLPVSVNNKPYSDINLPVIEADGKLVGLGQLFLTNQRIIWKPISAERKLSESSADYHTFSHALLKLDGIYAVLNLGLSIVAGMQQYTLHFSSESPLKWVTYAALLAEEVQAVSGHRIHTSHY